MKDVFVDTSAWCALVDRRDEFHRQARSALERLDGEGAVLHTTDVVFHETAGLVRVKLGKAVAVEWGEEVLSNPGVRLQEIGAGALKEAWRRFRSSGAGVSLVDCHSFVAMERMGLRVAFAFDRDFRDAGFVMLP
ncbi:MAG: PIN domain-containing protein [Nitrospirae bacterium]|nr:PIN domain-containing protein [Nitrospirota bacterium]